MLISLASFSFYDVYVYISLNGCYLEIVSYLEYILKDNHACEL